MSTWIDQAIHFIDFEGNRSSGILEFGIATVLGGKITDARTRLCSATGRIHSDETEVHGLSAADVAGSPPFSEEWNTFIALRNSGPLAAHYAGTENGLLKAVWPYPRHSPDFTKPGGQSADWGPWIDTASIYAQLYPALDCGKLETLIERCGLQAELDALAASYCPPQRRRYHAALYDALAGALLLAALARHASIAELTLLQLFSLSTRSGDKRDNLQQQSLF
ncbi:MAG: 3'-5' exonuclease [Opitutaceae bacterium]